MKAKNDSVKERYMEAYKEETRRAKTVYISDEKFGKVNQDLSGYRKLF